MKKLLVFGLRTALLAACLLSGCGASGAEGGLSLAGLLAGDIRSLSVAGYGSSRELNEAETAELLELAKGISYSRSPSADMSEPGAVSVIIRAQYADGAERTLTLPYYSADGVTYAAENSCVTYFAPFLD